MMRYVLSIQDRLRALADALDKSASETAHNIADQMDHLEWRGKTFTGKYERLTEEANDILTERDDENQHRLLDEADPAA